MTDSAAIADAPPEFRGEFHRELTMLLRRRFVWLCASWLGLIVIGVVLALLGRWIDQTYGSGGVDAGGAPWYRGVAQPSVVLDKLGRALVIGFSLALVLRHRLRLSQILNAAHWVIVGTAMVGLLAALVESHGGGVDVGAGEMALARAAGRPLSGVIMIVAMNHFLVCLFLPWTPGQALRPLQVVYPMWAVTALLHDGFSADLVYSGLIGAPIIIGLGLLQLHFRQRHIHKRFLLHALRRRFTQSRRDLVDAREIHERRFPRPLTGGPFRLDYFYEPMRQIGGDFLHAHIDEGSGDLHVALIDVTGHGIAAALTVNRIDGELQRLYAEAPDATPGEVMKLLNRYIYLTMSRHGIYATGICLRLNRDGVVEYCNAGHPPAFLRRAGGGKVEQLDSTTFMLGVCPDDVFDGEATTISLDEGDAFLAYTDGACEAADRRGKQLGIKGLARVVGSWREGAGVDLIPFLPNAVRHYRSGPAQDDVLFAALRRGQS